MTEVNITDYLTDPLSETTRKERRNLLIASTIGILVAKMGLIPSQISALGIEFSAPNQQVFIQLVGFIIIYFLIAFVTCGLPDFFIWRKKLQDYLLARNIKASSWTEQDEYYEDEAHHGIARARWLYTMSKPVAFLRIFFEFIIPFGVSIYAISILMCKYLSR